MNSNDISSLLKRCDLAIEAREMITRHADSAIKGVETETVRLQHAIIHRTNIIDEEGAKAIGKQVGRYITLEVPEVRMQDDNINNEISKVFAQELQQMYNLQQDTVSLVVGLGNWNVTPDALGPRVVNQLFVTRHLYSYMPDVLTAQNHNVAAISPGVLGITGVETGDIIKGVVEQIKPDIIFCIDALAANSVDRLSTTIQISDSGIHPGSGVGNKRTSIDQATMGVPVVAIGVPTVVHAITLVNNAMKLITQQNEEQPMLPAQEELFRRILDPYVGALVVTPKEVDVLIDDISYVLSDGFNYYFHGQEA